MPSKLLKTISRLLRKLMRQLSRATGSRADSAGNSPNIGQSFVLEDEWADFRKLAVRAERYAEYGAGESTVFVSRASKAEIKSIETDIQWVKAVEESLVRKGEVILIDLGPTGRWGRPKSYDYSDRFPAYRTAPFENGYSPDLVLIDGRFRVACFCQILLSAEAGTSIVFDDYVKRPYYHIVERVLKPRKVGARQAVFVVPKNFDRQATSQLLDKFEYVLE